MPKREKIGEITVDAGICWVGDPCYILQAEKMPKSLGKDWLGFCNKLGNKDTRKFKHDNGRSGLCVVTTTGLGDGVFPVFIERGLYGRVSRLVVEFLPDEDPEEA